MKERNVDMICERKQYIRNEVFRPMGLMDRRFGPVPENPTTSIVSRSRKVLGGCGCGGGFRGLHSQSSANSKEPGPSPQRTSEGPPLRKIIWGQGFLRGGKNQKNSGKKSGSRSGDMQLCRAGRGRSSIVRMSQSSGKKSERATERNEGVWESRPKSKTAIGNLQKEQTTEEETDSMGVLAEKFI